MGWHTWVLGSEGRVTEIFPLIANTLSLSGEPWKGVCFTSKWVCSQVAKLLLEDAGSYLVIGGGRVPGKGSCLRGTLFWPPILIAACFLLSVTPDCWWWHPCLIGLKSWLGVKGQQSLMRGDLTVP